MSGLLEALQHYKKLDTNDYFVIGLWDGIWDGSDPAQYFVGSLQVSRLYKIYNSMTINMISSLVGFHPSNIIYICLKETNVARGPQYCSNFTTETQCHKPLIYI